MNRPGSSASTASSTTLPGVPSSYDVKYSDTAVSSGPLTAEPTLTPVVGCEHAGPAVWLAPTSLQFITNLRYSRRDKLNYAKEEVVEAVPPLNAIKFRPDTLGTLGWQPYEHPEGSVYFRAENFYTNLWLYDVASIEAVEEVVKKLRAKLASHPRLTARNVEFGVDLIDDDEADARPGDKLGCYYAVDGTTEEAFWLHEVPLSFYYDGTETKVISREHLRHGARMGYWDHCYMFPHGRNLSADTVEGLQATLCYNMFDKTTSPTSVLPYNYDDAERLLRVFENVKASSSSGKYVRPEHVVMVARMQSTFLREKFIHFHGERFAQLDSDKSVFEEDPKDSRHSRLFEATSWLCFSTPQVYYEQLSHIWVDNKVNYDSWRNFIHGLQTDWAVYTIPATVVLAANVAFLAVQSVDQGGNAATDRTIGQTASYISTLLNVGCVAATLILAEQHRPANHNRSEQALVYLLDRALSKSGVERLAVIFSIPAAFFRWGLLAFLVAIIGLCLRDTNGATQVAVCVVAGISILFLTAIVCNGEWKSRLSTSPLATCIKCVHRLLTTSVLYRRWKRLRDPSLTTQQA